MIGSGFSTMFSSRGSLASWYLVFVLLAGVLPFCGVFSILLIPLFFFYIALVAVPLSRAIQSSSAHPFPCVTLFPSRAPPLE
jgi:hypothetical protein